MTTHQVTYKLQKPAGGDLKSLFLKIPNESSFLQKLTSGQTIVTYNRKTEKAEQYKKPFFSVSKLGNDQLDYYLVDTYSSLHETLKCDLTSNYHKELSFGIRLDDIQVKKGSELIATELLARRNNPVEAFTKLMYDTTATILQSAAHQAYQDFESFGLELARRLKSEIAKSGLSLGNCTLVKSVIDTSPNRIEFNGVEVRIQPLDFTGFVNLRFDALLVPDEGLSSSISSELTYRNKEDFREFLVAQVKAFIRTKINYNTLSKHQDDFVRRSLIAHWNSRLRELGKGWQVGELVLYFPDSVPPEFKRESLQVTVALKNAEIPLTNTIILYLEDAQRFQNSGIKNIEAWIGEKLKKVAQQVLANITYAELVSKFDEYRKIIKAQLDQEVKLIGYKVDYLLTSELISSSQLQFDFTLNEQEQIFEAKNDIITLKAWFSGRITSINHSTWKKILTPQTNLVEEIKKEVIRLIGQTILNAEADNFYSSLNTEIPAILKASIAELLKIKFNVEQDVYIQIIIEQSELKKRFEELATGSHTAEVSLLGNAALFKVKFSVSGVSHWEKFATRRYISTEDEIRNITEDVKEGFETWLNQNIEAGLLPHRHLINALLNIKNQIINRVETNRYVLLTLENIFEVKNEVKETRAKGEVENIKNDYLEWQEQRKKLKQELRKAIESESSSESISKIKNDLKEIESNLKGQSDDSEGFLRLPE